MGKGELLATVGRLDSVTATEMRAVSLPVSPGYESSIPIRHIRPIRARVTACDYAGPVPRCFAICRPSIPDLMRGVAFRQPCIDERAKSNRAQE